jgi:hypothetical protein
LCPVPASLSSEGANNCHTRNGRRGRVEAEARIDVARSVAHMASLSLEANVQFMTVMATKMPYIGCG